MNIGRRLFDTWFFLYGHCHSVANREAKTLSFTPELAEFVDARVKSGRYQSVSEVVRAGLRLLQDRELQYEQQRAAIALGAKQLDRGEVIDGQEFFARLQAKHNSLVNE